MTWIELMRRRGLAVLAAAGLGSLALASVASAATFNVNDTRDLMQSSTAASGSCVSTAQTCTLRAAVQAANEVGGASTINLPAGTYPIGSSTTGATPDPTTGDFKVNFNNNSTSITVVGAGAGSTVINAQGKDRVFEVWPNGSLDVQKMTLENGVGTGSDDTTPPVALPNGNGGAIDSDGHVSAESVTFTGNAVTTGNYDGGSVAAEDVPGSTLSATGDVFQNNSAEYGGAVYTNAPNDVTISFSLLQANNATSGFEPGGGAIYGDGGAAGLTLNFDDFVQNVASGSDSFAGGVEWDGKGALGITNSLFNQNQESGGGAAAEAGAVEDDSEVNVNIANTSFDGNSGARGGAIANFGSNALTLTQDKFSDNASPTEGGALYLDSSYGGPTSIADSEFDGNAAPNGTGGAIDWYEGPLALTGDSFVLNTAGYGGALNSINSWPLTMIDSTMSRNTGTSGAGAIGLNEEIHVTLTNDTIAFNNAPAGSGGGIDFANMFVSGGSASTSFGVENTTVAENSGGDCSSNRGAGPFPKSTDLGNNNDSDQSCFGGDGGSGDLVGVNPLLSNPANNGGPAAGGPGDTETVQTDAEQASSPTVDAGSNNGCPSVDERGVSRPQGKACDIGAFEFGGSPLTTTSTATSSVTTITCHARDQGAAGYPCSLPPQTTTTTTSTRSTPKNCPSGKHKSKGKCVRNKKPKHKKKCPKGKVRKGAKCVKHHKKGRKK